LNSDLQEIKMLSSKITIRPATIADLDALVDLHLRSFSPKDHLAVKLGTGYIRSVYHWFITSQETFTLVAEHENKIVGLTTVCDRFYNKPMLGNTLSQAMAGILLHPWLILDAEILERLYTFFLKRKRAEKTVRNKEPLVSQLAFIAVDNSMRGKGLGVQLLKQAKNESHKRGGAKMLAGVYENNLSSIKAFEKAGFHILPNSVTRKLIYVEADLEGTDD